jgi:hypothetical protein
VVIQVKKSKVSASLAALILPLLSLLTLSPAVAQDTADDMADLRQLVEDMRQDYEARIGDLEERLARTERLAMGAQRDADEAAELAEQTAIDQSSGASAPNTFNPSIGAVLAGRYADVNRGWDEIPGFQPGGEIGTGNSGFALSEAEINLKASVDNRFFGNLTIGVHEDDGETEVGVEEAWLQTTDLPLGLSVTGGRFFSAAGYLNNFHFHADDFIDRPLPYQAFFGGRYAVDGIQARWIAPTSLLFEVGGEVNWGGGFPASANAESSPGAWTLFAKAGGDVGDSHSWQAGLSHTSVDAMDRGGAHEHAGGAVSELFSGDSDLTVADFVWKWAPQGNSTVRSFKLQGEYFSRSEDGLFAGIPYDGDQDGWYLQSVLQFAQVWRVGLRHDAVDASNGASLVGTELENPGRSSYRDSLMLDWSPSEFSRLRMQYTNDNVQADSDHQWTLQYIMSIGAHGGHQF